MVGGWKSNGNLVPQCAIVGLDQTEGIEAVLRKEVRSHGELAALSLVITDVVILRKSERAVESRETRSPGRVSIRLVYVGRTGRSHRARY